MRSEELLREARALGEELKATRRTLHHGAEVGMELPRTRALVESRLREMGVEPRRCGRSGVTATIGRGGRCILLRADMDALPMRDESGLPFAADNGNCHACGHDCHTAMLLSAAKLLKAHEAELCGTVKLMFQPGEEVGQGAADMIADGLMSSPTPDAALGLHVAISFPDSDIGNVKCIRGYYGRFVGSLTVTVRGREAHGAASWRGVDALSIASFINLALEAVIAREISSDENSIILTGTLRGGTTANTVAGEAVMGVTVRAPNRDRYNFLVGRIEEAAGHIAAAFRGEATVRQEHGIAAPFNDPAFTEDCAAYASELLGSERVILTDKSMGAGDDFAYVTDMTPGALLNVGFGSRGQGYTTGGHNPHVVFNEDALPVGAALYAYLALRWLETHGKTRN